MTAPCQPTSSTFRDHSEITPIVESLQDWWRLLVHNRFRQRVREPLLGLSLPRWEIDPHCDLKYHLPQVSLPAPGGQMELQRLVGDLISRPLDRAHPLWRFFCVENYQGGCALVPVLHHCIADGLALVQVLLALTDPQPDTSVFRRPTPPDRAAVHRSGPAAFRPLAQLFDSTALLARSATREALLTIWEPARVTQAASLGVLSVNAASKLLLTSPDQKTIAYGPCGVEKRAAWSPAIPLSDVIRVGRALSTTEQHELKQGMRSADGFVVRRCQIILASARGERAPAIAHQLGCDDQTVREIIQAFDRSGLSVLLLLRNCHTPYPCVEENGQDYCQIATPL